MFFINNFMLFLVSFKTLFSILTFFLFNNSLTVLNVHSPMFLFFSMLYCSILPNSQTVKIMFKKCFPPQIHVALVLTVHCPMLPNSQTVECLFYTLTYSQTVSLRRPFSLARCLIPYT